MGGTNKINSYSTFHTIKYLGKELVVGARKIRYLKYVNKGMDGDLLKEYAFALILSDIWGDPTYPVEPLSFEKNPIMIP